MQAPLWREIAERLDHARRRDGADCNDAGGRAAADAWSMAARLPQAWMRSSTSCAPSRPLAANPSPPLKSASAQRTGIGSLKVRYNSVFGYYIEITKANLALAPADYERKQTLVNAERFTTPELKEYERKILTAHDRSHRDREADLRRTAEDCA